MRRASIDLPLPGGPIISMLWPPAAATSSARLSAWWPRTWARSSSSPPGASQQRVPDRRGTGVGRRVPASRSPSWRTRLDADDLEPIDQRGLGGVRGGDDQPLEARTARAGSAIASAPRTGRTEPSSPSSPPPRSAARRSAGTWPLAASSAAASARSNPGPALRRSAGRQVHGDPPQRELEPAS